jgi:stage II sporulation protein D
LLIRRTLLTTFLIALLALPATAGAATRWVVKGAGWGHGIGMSQYGAYGLAQQGRSYREILGHYYTGTEVSRAETQTIRVLLQANRREVTFTGATQAGDRALQPGKTYVARSKGGGVELRDNKGKMVGSFPPPMGVQSQSFRLGGTAINGIKDGTYHGNIEVRPSVGGGLTAVNALSLDEYVQGVVPGEMPSGWHPEALKAQAVAARSYALVTNRGGDVFDQYPDTRSQVYRGVDGEMASTNAAVAATAGEVVKYQGRIAVTYFFSTSGGHTENIENVFYGAEPAPYLRGVPDPTDAISPRYRWTFTFTRKQIESRLRNYLKGGKLKAIKVRKRGVSRRIVSADVVGTRGSTRVTGTNLRQALGVYDNWMSFKRVTTSATRQTNVRKAGLGAIVFGGGRGIVGLIDPVPGGRKLVVERRTKGRWRKAASGTTGRSGAYRVHLSRSGTYRVRAGGVTGPAVRVR